jgi:GTP-binding protein Era
MIIGKKGAMLKKIGTEARMGIEDFLGCRVNLQLWVKVREDWRNRDTMLRSLGY